MEYGLVWSGVVNLNVKAWSHVAREDIERRVVKVVDSVVDLIVNLVVDLVV